MIRPLTLLAAALVVGGALYLVFGRGDEDSVEAPTDVGPVDATSAPRRADRPRTTATPVPAASLSGRCVDAEGRGLSARVALSFSPPPGRGHSDEPPTDMSIDTDAEGRFRVELDRYLGLSLLARAPGRVDAERRDLLFTGRPLVLGDLVLAAGRTLRVRVYDDQDQPVTGAEIEAGPLLPRGQERGDGGTFFAGIDARRLRSAKTDAAGRATLSGLVDAALQLRVRAPGFLPWAARDHEVGALDDELEIRLGRGRTIALTVRDDQGAPIAEAEAALDAMGYAPEDALLSDSLRRRTTTDSRGQCQIGPLGPRPYRLRVRAAGFLASADRIIRPGEISAEVTLASAGRIRGRLLNADGAPVPIKEGLTLVAQKRRGRDQGGRLLLGAELTRLGLSGDDAFAVDRLEGSRLRLSWDGPGYARGFVDVTGIRSREEREVRVRLVTATAAEGRVLRFDGRPIAGARVSARLASAPGFGRDPQAERAFLEGGYKTIDDRPADLKLRPALRLEVMTGPDGTFRFEGLYPRARYVFAAESPEHGASETGEFVVTRKGLGGLDLRLPPVGAVSVVVKDGEGRARPGMPVFLRREEPDIPTDPLARVLLGDIIAKGWSDIEGRCRFAGIEPGTYVIDTGRRPGERPEGRITVNILAGGDETYDLGPERLATPRDDPMTPEPLRSRPPR